MPNQPCKGVAVDVGGRVVVGTGIVVAEIVVAAVVVGGRVVIVVVAKSRRLKQVNPAMATDWTSSVAAWSPVVKSKLLMARSFLPYSVQAPVCL